VRHPISSRHGHKRISMPAVVWHNGAIPQIMAQDAFENQHRELCLLARILVRYVG
jgi:hypothetical protein